MEQDDGYEEDQGDNEDLGDMVEVVCSGMTQCLIIRMHNDTTVTLDVEESDMESEGEAATDEENSISITPLRDDALRTFSQHSGNL